MREEKMYLVVGSGENQTNTVYATVEAKSCKEAIRGEKNEN